MPGFLGIPPTEAIANVITNRGASVPDVIQAFGRANYLLNASDGAERVGGTYRDAHASNWRSILADEVATAGDDEQTSAVFISAEPRPARSAFELPAAGETWHLRTDVEVEWTGTAYVELKLPEQASPAYDITLSGNGPDSAAAATAIAFSEYPIPCAESRFEMSASNEGAMRLVLPAECTSITIILSHVLTGPADDLDIEVTVKAASVTDSFERSIANGWGVADSSRVWRDKSGAPVDGSVANGAGRLAYGGNSARLRRVNDNPDEVILIGRFTDCEGVGQSAVIGLYGIRDVYLTTSGSFFGPGVGLSLTGFDACAPWYMRIAGSSELSLAKVWQTTDPEPAEWMLEFVPPFQNARNDLTISTSGAGAPGEYLIIDVLDVHQGPTG